MKKSVKAFFFILLLLFIGIESYWFFEDDGNLIVFIQNQSDSIDEIPVKVNLGTENVFDSNVSKTDFFPQEVSLKKWAGFYSLTVARGDLQRIEEKGVSLVLVTWIVINVSSEDIRIEQHLMPPVFQ